MKLDEFFAEHPKAALAFSGGRLMQPWLPLVWKMVPPNLLLHVASWKPMPPLKGIQ